MTKPYRVLVTGSRDWCNCTAIADALQHAFAAAEHQMIVVHGACPTGADWHADHYAKWMRDIGLPVDVEPHPANWRPNGTLDRTAGFRRNAEMVSLGAELCLAFLAPCVNPRCRKPRPHASHGAARTADLAEKAGISTRRWIANQSKEPS